VWSDDFERLMQRSFFFDIPSREGALDVLYAEREDIPRVLEFVGE
jgi:hypothetical protein